MDKNSHILVVMGGMSSEKEISLMSGSEIYDALIEKGYNAEKFILTENNVTDIINKKPDCVFLALHGKGGEDGTIQGLLEMSKIPYTGSGVSASAIGINKILTKKILKYHNISTPDFLYLSRFDDFNVEQIVQNVEDKFNYPVVVKAPCQGSSVGVKIVADIEDLRAAISEIYKYDNELLFEQYVEGKELTHPVYYDSGKVKCLPIIEIVFKNEFYDYESKYTVGKCKHIIPAGIDADVYESVEKMTVEAYKALGCNGFARVDYILSDDNIPYIIEINTMPGTTKTSLLPDAVRAAGMEFADFVEMMLLNIDK